jgi:transcriptional regulator with XRE-family HTH domain
MSAYAKELGIGPLSLRHFIQGKTQRPREKTLDLIASDLDMSIDEVRRQAALPPPSGPDFASWLAAHMDDRYSRSRLAKETGISDGALRNYLDGRTLPDADQAQRLAEVLDAPPLEIAHIIIAGQAAQADDADGEPVDQGEPGDSDTLSPVTATLAPALTPDALAQGMYATSTMVNGVDVSTPGAAKYPNANLDEERLLNLWRQLHPQGRRATLIYIAGLLAES